MGRGACRVASAVMMKYFSSHLSHQLPQAISTILTLLMLPDRVGRSHERSKAMIEFISNQMNCNQINILCFLNPKVFATLKLSSDA